MPIEALVKQKRCQTNIFERVFNRISCLYILSLRGIHLIELGFRRLFLDLFHVPFLLRKGEITEDQLRTGKRFRPT